MPVTHFASLPIRSVTIVRWVGLSIALSLNAVTALAGAPRLAFDFGRTAECRDVTQELVDSDDFDSEFSTAEKIVELKLRVSVQLLSGKLKDVREVRIEIGDCDSRMRVESFAPNTRLQSDYSKDIVVTKTVEKGKSLNASLGGEFPIPVGDVVAAVLPGANAGLSKRDVITEKQSRHAPQYAVVASGTIKQEHGVFFKLRSSSQTTLEGSHELTVRFLVPAGWRGDSLRVCCSASGIEKFLWTKQQATWSRTCAPVAIYLEGDSEARLAAEAYTTRHSL